MLNSYLIPLFRRVTEGVPPPQGLPPAPLTISGGEGDRAGAPPPAGTDDNVVIGDVVESGSGEVGEEGYSVGEDESGSQGPDEHFEDYDDSDEYDQEVEGIAGSKGGGSKVRTSDQESGPAPCHCCVFVFVCVFPAVRTRLLGAAGDRRP